MIEEGCTYKSPNYGRNIMVLAIDKQDADTYTLDIFWVERDTNLTTPDSLVVSKQDAERWTKVTY